MFEPRYEEWIAVGRHDFVPLQDHPRQVLQKGWWCTGWQGTAVEVEERKRAYKAREEERAAAEEPK
jgi:hypothetical protein